eukprot:359722-Chlamydomonas_euryale.AAC.2
MAEEFGQPIKACHLEFGRFFLSWISGMGLDRVIQAMGSNFVQVLRCVLVHAGTGATSRHAAAAQDTLLACIVCESCASCGAKCTVPPRPTAGKPLIC